jgi:hypothetical protein
LSDAGTEGGSTLGLVPVRRALLSVSDKTDLVPFARALAEAGVEIVSTGGTATALAAAGLRVVTVEELTAACSPAATSPRIERRSRRTASRRSISSA